MNRNEKPSSRQDRSKRVVSLPCGHQVRVDLDASLLAISGPVLDHQATCRPEPPPNYAAWFPLGPLSKGEAESLLGRLLG
jgi:hypothetical protein